MEDEFLVPLLAGSVNSTPAEADPAAASESWNLERSTLAAKGGNVMF